MRIRSRLLLLVLAVLVPAVLGSGLGGAYLYREHQKFHRESLRETARALALALDREMARREAILRTLAVSPLLRRGELQPFYDFAREVAVERDATIILSDLEGRQIINTRLPFGAPLPPMLPAERQLRARYGNEAVLVSNVYQPPAGLGPPSFAVQVPVRREGRVVQFLTLAAYASQLQALLGQQRLPSGWHATVIDRDGRVAARSIDVEKFLGQPVRPELAQRLAASEEGFQEGRSLGGVSGTAFFSRSPGSQWTFLVSVPNVSMESTGTQAVALLTFITLILTGIGLAAALGVGRHIARPIEALRESAARLGRNEPVQAQRFGIDELDAVHAALSDAGVQLRSANAELERRIAEALASYEQSQRTLVQAQKLEALGRLTGGIAHDFNNVLQTLTAGLEAARRRAPEELRETIARCQRAVARGTDLARQLMVFGRVQDIRSRTIDTAQRIAEARPLLEGGLPSNVRLDVELAPGLWPVTVDPAQLELALLNLVVNARDALPAGGRIALRGGHRTLEHAQQDLPAGDYVELTVSDTGDGMSEEVLAQAIDPFYTTKSVGKGSGMGLPQAYGFAKQSGGTLRLHSRRGEGTTAALWLPRARGAVEPIAHMPARIAPPAARGAVLLVEDDDLVRETVSSALQAAGFDISPCASADEAMRRLDRGDRFDAVLTDVVMPGTLSGLDLARQILDRHPRIGVIVATGYSDRRVDLPGVRTLPKPYDVQQAIEALNAALAG